MSTPRTTETTEVELAARTIGAPAAIGASVLAGLLTALLSLPGGLMLWVGISVAVGRGDPTWNDGEETWATALGLILTGALGLAIFFGVRALAGLAARGLRMVMVGLWVAPAVLVHVLLAVAFVG